MAWVWIVYLSSENLSESAMNSLKKVPVCMRFEWAWGIFYITMGLVKALPVILGLWSHEVCCLCTGYGFCWKQEQPWWRFLCGHRANPPGSARRSWADIWFIHSTQEHHGWEHHCILHSWNPLGNVWFGQGVHPDPRTEIPQAQNLPKGLSLALS